LKNEIFAEPNSSGRSGDDNAKHQSWRQGHPHVSSPNHEDNGSLAKGPTGTCSQSIPGAELVNDFGANKRFTVDVNAWQLGYHLLLNVADLTREP